VEGTTLQVVSIVAGVAAALTATNVVTNLVAETAKAIARVQTIKKSLLQTPSKKRYSTKRTHRIEEDETHEKFLQIQRLLKEGKSREAEEIFRRAKTTTDLMG
jgi:hypothetical protein